MIRTTIDPSWEPKKLLSAYEKEGCEDSDESPIDFQLRVLDGRMASIDGLLGDLTAKLSPILRPDGPPSEGTASCRTVGESPVHEALIRLNERASDIARFIARTQARVTT